MRNRFLRLIAVSAAIAVLVASAPFSVFAETGEELKPAGTGELITSGNDSGLVDYRDYTATYKDVAFATEGDKVMLSGAQGVADDESEAKAESDFSATRSDKEISAKDVLVWDSGKGSVEYTSVPKPPIFPFFIASHNAISSVTAPLAVFTRIASFFIFSIRSLLISPLVSSDNGMCTVIISLFFIKLSMSVHSTPSV